MKYNTIFFDFGDTLNHPDPIEHWAVYKWVPSLINKLYYASYKLGIISNTSRYQDGWWVRNKLAENNILHQFEMVISSATYGIHKPNMDIFKKALRFMDVDPRNAVMVGDSEHCDGGCRYFDIKYLKVIPQADWSQSLLDLLQDKFPSNRKMVNLCECHLDRDKIITKVRHLSAVVVAGDSIVAKGKEYRVLEVSPNFTIDDWMHKDHFIHFTVEEIHG